MNRINSDALQNFQNLVGIKFQLYNSLFLSLPFYGIEKTGILLSLFGQTCEEGYKNGKSPAEIVESFFKNHTSISDDDKKIDLLFRFVQYAERQVVLFDALEDASFEKLNDLSGAGTLKQLEAAVFQSNRKKEFLEKLEDFSVRLVLTAHPTQFYPGSVLGIINDLTEAIEENEVGRINVLLQQLGRTPFFKKQKPTPFDEAVSLIWYLENVFYDAVGNIISEIKNTFSEEEINLENIIKMGFWSGGDRDGNPFVKVETTVKTANALRLAIIRCYYLDVRKLKRRLTFSGVESLLGELEAELYKNAFQAEENCHLTEAKILKYLLEIRRIIVEKHDGLFVHLIEDLICKTKLFGLHFATLDIRQDSGVHENIYRANCRKYRRSAEKLPDAFRS